MIDLREQLREYFDDLADEAVAASIVVVPARNGHRRAVAVAAAVLAIALAVAGLFVARGGSDTDRVRVGGAKRSEVRLVGFGTGTDYQDLVFADPDTGTLRRLPTGSRAAPTAPTVIDGVIWGDDAEGLFRVDPPYEKATRVDPARGLVFSSAQGDGLWLASGSGDGASVRRVDLKNNSVSNAIAMPSGYVLVDQPAAAITDGILVYTPGYPRTLAVWNPESGEVRGLAGNVSNLGSVYTAPGARTSKVVYRDADQRLHVLDTATGASASISVDGNDVRGIGGGAFSPDGQTFAAFINVSTSDVGNVPGGRIAQLMLVDAATGNARVVEHDPVTFGEEYGWATWAPDGSRVFFGASGPAFAVARDQQRATPLAVSNNYTWTALEVPVRTTEAPNPPPTTEQALPLRLAPPDGATIYRTYVQTGQVPNQPIMRLWGYLGPQDEQPPLLIAYLIDYRTIGGNTLEQRGCTTGTPNLQTSGRIIDLDGREACMGHPTADGAYVNWEVTPGVVVDVRGEGLTDDQLLDVARSVRVRDDLDSLEMPTRMPADLELVGTGPGLADTESVATQFSEGECEYVLNVEQTSPARIVSLMTATQRRRTTVLGVPAVMNSSMIGWSPRAGTTVILNMQPIQRQERCADPALVDVAERIQDLDEIAWQQHLADLGDRVTHTDRSQPAPR